MSEINWDGIVNGFRIILGVQLIVVALPHLFNKKHRNLPLGFICLVVALYFFWRFLLPYRETTLARIFLFSNRELFVPPLAYLILFRINNVLNTRIVLRHLITPSLIALIAISILVPFYNDIPNIRLVANSISLPAITLISIVYFFLGKHLLKQLKRVLIPKAYTKYKVFFYVVVFWYFNMGFTSTLSYFVQYQYLLLNYGDPGPGICSEDTGIFMVDLLGKFFNGPYDYYNTIISTPLLYLAPIFLFLFALSELHYFKSLFLPKDIFYNQNVLNSGTGFSLKLNAYFNEVKPFKNQQFSMDECCVNLNCTKKELSDYLKLYEKSTFNEYLNLHRTKAFKLMLMDKSNAIYDINSLAEMAGFKSRATFYRVFKEIEGVTPTEYKKNLQA